MVKITSREQTRRTEYNRIREKPFTRIHGKPSLTDYDLLVEETKKIAVTVQIPAYDVWVDKYGLLTEAIGDTEYLAKIGLDYIEPTKLSDYDPGIQNNHSVITKARREAEWESKKESYAVVEGARQGICKYICDALDKQFYEQLKDNDLGYGEASIKDHLDHLSQKWCKLNTKMIQKMKECFYHGWQEGMHITAFPTCLNREQKELAR